MAVITDIKNLSQTASLNGPDGAVDPPSTLDDQDRFLGSFIAMLRDGVGFTAGALVVSLGYTPVRQGGSSSGGTNTVSIGWNGALGRLVLAVDGNQFADQWPIRVDGTARGLRSNGAAGGAEIQLAWNDPGDVPGYLYGGHTPTDGRVVPASRLRVSYADSSNYANGAGYATSAGSAPANGGTAQNSNQVSGVGGWSYSNHGNNPAYLWATEGDGQSQHLTVPGALTVNRADNCRYADSAGSAPANGGNATNADNLQGRGSDYWLNNGNSSLRNVRNNGTMQLIAEIAGTGDRWWAVNVSDARLKKDVTDTEVDSLANIERMHFVGYRWREDMGYVIDPNAGHFHPLGVLAQEAEQIESNWFPKVTDIKQPDAYAMLMSAMHAIQQLSRKVKALQAKLQGAS